MESSVEVSQVESEAAHDALRPIGFGFAALVVLLVLFQLATTSIMVWAIWTADLPMGGGMESAMAATVFFPFHLGSLPLGIGAARRLREAGHPLISKLIYGLQGLALLCVGLAVALIEG
ncbi:MAG: hypothetical protein KDB07_10430 [Planctomycetes bacterium]|nr:hypothetical protein [Planctomycetota bacterium]